MASLATADEGISRNLNGQKLGRKGKDTRARILAAAAEIVAEGNEQAITLSAVARRASLGMTSLYLYFNDLTELLIAVLEPVRETAEADYIVKLRKRWPDEELAAHCRSFVEAHHAYWSRHSRLLHLRNSMADAHDRRMMEHRIASAMPVIQLLAGQMDARPDEEPRSPVYAMASLLMTSMERAATVWTDSELHRMLDSPAFTDINRLLVPAARILELGIREGREQSRGRP